MITKNINDGKADRRYSFLRVPGKIKEVTKRDFTP
jgi:hypothetical protein